MSKLCVIYNSAPHYRSAIFRKMDGFYDCDWYFGEHQGDIREIDFSLLNNVTKCKSWGKPNKAYWIKGVVPLIFKKKYETFFMFGDTRVLSFWIFWFLAFLFFRRKKIYIWSHAWYGKESWLEAKLKLWLCRHSESVFTYGEYAKSCLSKHGIDPSKIHPIKNSLDYETQLEMRRRMKSSTLFKSHFGNGFPTMIFIGRLTYAKRLDMLIEALSMLRCKGESYNLLIVGDGAAKANLMQCVEDSGLEENVWFFGESYDEYENAQLLYNSDLCVSPGNVGLTAIHAMMYGTPVITHGKFESQGPEFEAVKPGMTGDFFEYGNLDSLTMCISSWFKNNAGRREVIRQKCFDEVDSFWNPNYQMEVLKENLVLTGGKCLK